MTQRQPRSTTTTQSTTMNNDLFTREAILMMAKGISNVMIVCALVFTQINGESVTNRRATIFNEVKIVERLIRKVVVANRCVCWLVIWI